MPEPSILNVWQLLRRMQEHFWTRWSSEYLHELQHRPKWRSQEPNVRAGQLCIIRSNLSPPCKWPLARTWKHCRAETASYESSNSRPQFLRSSGPSPRLVFYRSIMKKTVRHYLAKGEGCLRTLPYQAFPHVNTLTITHTDITNTLNRSLASKICTRRDTLVSLSRAAIGSTHANYSIPNTHLK